MLLLQVSSLSFPLEPSDLSYAERKLLTDTEPYKHEGNLPSWFLISRIINKDKPLRPTAKAYHLLNRDGSHDFCWPIMQACWKHSPKERITSREAYERLRKGSPSLALN